MKLCRVRKNFRYIDCTYKAKHCTWYLDNQSTPWESDTKLDNEYLVPIPAHFSTPSMS